METTEWVVLAVVVGVLVVAVLGFAGWRWRRRSVLRHRFGPEYDRAVEAAGSRRKAEHELLTRQERYARIELRPLPEASRARLSEEWDQTERLFVDDPELAARQADHVVRNVLGERGYPSDDLEAAAAAASVEHPRAMERYRHGHDLVVSNGDGNQRTENLRQAMVDFRAVFAEMVEPEHEPAAH